MSIKPLGARVLIKPKTEEKTKGGIYLAGNESEDTNIGKVVAVGDAKDMPVKQGDMVLFEPLGRTDVESEGEKLVIVKKDSVIARLE